MKSRSDELQEKADKADKIRSELRKKLCEIAPTEMVLDFEEAVFVSIEANDSLFKNKWR